MLPVGLVILTVQSVIILMLTGARLVLTIMGLYLEEVMSDTVDLFVPVTVMRVQRLQPTVQNALEANI